MPSFWQEEVPLKFHTGKRKRKSAIFFFYPFIWMFSHFGLLRFWFTNEFSETALLLLFFFLMKYLIFSLKTDTITRTWWILLNPLVLSAEFNLTLSTKSEKVFLYNSWAVLDIPYSSLHLSNSPNIYWMPATESLA